MNQSKNGPKNEIDISPKKTYRWLLMRVKEGSDKLNIQKTKIMASGVPTLNANRWGKVKAVIDFIFLGFKITAGSDCSHEIKRHLLLEKESYDKTRKYIKKQRHRFVNRGLSVKAMVFPVVMCGCESWTVKKAGY